MLCFFLKAIKELFEKKGEKSNKRINIRLKKKGIKAGVGQKQQQRNQRESHENILNMIYIMYILLPQFAEPFYRHCTRCHNNAPD